jgi:phenylacetate-CoA ligase
MNQKNLQQESWNPYLETLDMDKIEALQLKRFKETLQYAIDSSPSYSKLYRDAGVSSADLTAFEHIRNVPVVEKTFFECKDKRHLYGDSLAVPEDEVVYFHQTSGTTSRPLRQPDTYEDWCWWAECWATVLWAQGIRPNDRVLFPFNYSTFIGFWGAHYACEKIGAEIISTGGMSTKERLGKIRELGITAIITTPTYAFRMAESAVEEGFDLAGSTVKTIVCAGEPGALIPSTKKELEDVWGARVLDHIGATEVGAWGFECLHSPGGIHINESMFLVELLELDSSKPIVEAGQYGRVVISAFHRKGRPVLRFDTRDLACWDSKQCACGRTFRLLKGGIQGRADHLLKVRGTFVTPAIIEDIVRQDQRLDTEYQLIVGQNGRDSLAVAVEVKPVVPQEEWSLIQRELAEKIHYKTQLRFEILVKKSGEIARGNFKSKRLVDLR